MIDFEDMVLGIDYENIDTLMEKTGLSTRQGINYRINDLKRRGIIIIRKYDNNRSPYFLREEADKLINYKRAPNKYPKNRKETPGVRPGKQKIKKAS